MKKIITNVIAALVCSASMNAQQGDSVASTSYRPFQASFISPMGTNGLESAKYTNNVSFNIVAGYAGGLRGFELGSFSNLILNDAEGVQVAGFCNTVLGKTRGTQVCGFSNVTRKTMKGAQVAGFANVVSDSATVVQVSGFSNVVNGSNTGSQLTGFANVTKGSADGAQIAGFSNYAHDDSKTVQIAGFSNMVKGNLTGAQVSGFSNNVAGDVTGVQLAGFINTAKKVNGTQIGFINICDTIEDGVAIGFLSIVKKGYRSLEVGTDESLPAQVNFKIGTTRFYNIFSGGVKPKSNDINWGFGYGLGSMISLSPKMNLNMDAICYQIYYNNIWIEDYSFLNKLRITASYRLTEKISVYVGPTFNVYVSNRVDSEGNLTSQSIAPWTSFDKARYNSVVQMYPGFTAGIKIN